MGECIIAHRSVVKNESQLLADITVSGSAVTQIDITGLNLVKGEEYELVISVIGGVTGDPRFYLFANNNLTNANYYTQLLYATGTTVASGRAAEAPIGNVNLNESSYHHIKIKLTNNGYFIFQCSQSRPLNSTIFLAEWYVTSTFTMTNITQLTIKGSISNGIGIGSRFQLYKVGGV